MKTDYQECLEVAEHAAEWLIRLPDASLAERCEFMDWLRRSPLHVREFLLAASCKRLLDQYVPFVELDANAFRQRNLYEIELRERVSQQRSPASLDSFDEPLVH